MKTPILLLISLIMVYVPAWAQIDYAVSNISPALTEKASAVIRNDRQIITIDPNGKTFKEVQYAITILDRDADEYGYVTIGYDETSDRISDIQAAIYDARGKRIKKFKNGDFEDFQPDSYGSLATSYRMKALSVSGVSYPYTVVYSYTKESNEIFDLPDWYLLSSRDVSLERSYLKIKTLAPVKLNYRAVNTNVKPIIKKEGIVTSYTWKFGPLQPFKREPMGPSFSEASPHIMLNTNMILMEDYQGSMESWKSFGQFFYELNKGRDGLPEELKSKVHELTDHLNTQEEKIATLYKYMQDNTRYVSVQLGIGGFQTFPAGYVYKNGYGDCKALSNYMKAMLNEIGITSHAVIIGAGRTKAPVPIDFVSSPFNHMILTVPMERDTIWLECTSSFSPIGYLGLFTENRHAVLLTPEGGKLVPTPKSTPENHAAYQTVEVYLEADGTAKVEAEILGLGDVSQYFVQLSNLTTPEDQEKRLRERWIDAPSFDLKDFQLEVLPPSNPPQAKLTYELDARNWASLSGSRIFLKPNILQDDLSLPKAVKKRTQPVINYTPIMQVDTIIYHLPANHIVEAMETKPVQIDWDFGSYRAQIEQVEPGLLRYTRTFQLERFEVPASSYESYRQFIKAAIKADRQQIVLSSRS